MVIPSLKATVPKSQAFAAERECVCTLVEPSADLVCCLPLVKLGQVEAVGDFSVKHTQFCGVNDTPREGAPQKGAVRWDRHHLHPCLPLLLVPGFPREFVPLGVQPGACLLLP